MIKSYEYCVETLENTYSIPFGFRLVFLSILSTQNCFAPKTKDFKMILGEKEVIILPVLYIPAVPLFTTTYAAYPVIKKYMIDPVDQTV